MSMTKHHRTYPQFMSYKRQTKKIKNNLTVQIAMRKNNVPKDWYTIGDVAEWEEWRALELQAQNTPQWWEQVGEDCYIFLHSLRNDLMPFLKHISLQALQNFCRSMGIYGSFSFWWDSWSPKHARCNIKWSMSSVHCRM